MFATWRCLCKTEHAYATEAIRTFVRKVCLRLGHTCVDSSVAIIRHAFANGHIYRLAANLWQRKRSFNALAAVKTATSIWASLPGGLNIDSVQEAILLHCHRCLVDVNQQYAMPLQAEPQFCTTTRRMAIIALRLQLKARPEKWLIFSRFPKLTFGSGLRPNDQLRRFSRISLSDSWFPTYGGYAPLGDDAQDDCNDGSWCYKQTSGRCITPQLTSIQQARF